jgi:group I intron endonuclease
LALTTDNLPKYSCIYEIRNIINGKVYIGSTKNYKKRIIVHLRKLKTNKHHSKYLQRSWNKHTEKNFRFNIICCIIDTNKLIELEQYFMDLYRSHNKYYGYNISRYAARPMPPWTGKKMSKKEKEKRSKTMKKNRQKEPFICLETGDVFINIIDARKKLKIKARSIGDILDGKRHSLNGYHFEYVDLNLRPTTRDKRKRKPVLCLENNKKYNSIKKASKELNIPETGIYNCLSGFQKTTRNHRFKYI